MSVNLREGRLQDYREDDEEALQLMQLISTEVNLHTFTFHITHLVSIDLVKQFIESHPTLTMFHITSYPESFETMVIKMPNGDWQIKVIQDEELVFTGDYEEYDQMLKRGRAQVEYEY